jgi:asparagine N-glycosylation enzyme membrane subunit Stt3
METLRQTQKKYCTRAITVAIFAGLLFILIDYKPIGKGLILGTVFSILNFILMGETLPLKIGKSKGKTLLFSLGSILFRYLILAVPLILALKFEQYNFVAVVIGIFFVQIFIMADHVLDFLWSARGKQV